MHSPMLASFTCCTTGYCAVAIDLARIILSSSCLSTLLSYTSSEPSNLALPFRSALTTRHTLDASFTLLPPILDPSSSPAHSCPRYYYSTERLSIRQSRRHPRLPTRRPPPPQFPRLGKTHRGSDCPPWKSTLGRHCCSQSSRVSRSRRHK